MHIQREMLTEETACPTQPQRRSETILVVDDNAKVVGEILKNADFKVLSAADGAGAVELANKTEGRIDLLLSDVDMPLMSGPELGLMLKKARPDLHVMLMSGGRERQSAGSQLRLGLYSEALRIGEARSK